MVGQGATERNDAMVFLSPTYANAVTTPNAAAIVTALTDVESILIDPGSNAVDLEIFVASATTA